MSSARIRIPASHPRQPFARYRAINERLPPESPRNIWKGLAYLLQFSVQYDSHFAARERTNRMIRIPKDEAVEVRQIARYFKGLNLPPALREEFVAASKAAHDQDAALWRTPLSYDVAVPRYLPARLNSAQQRMNLVRSKRAADLQFFYEDLVASDQFIGSHLLSLRLLPPERRYPQLLRLRDQPAQFCFGYSVQFASGALEPLSIPHKNLASSSMDQFAALQTAYRLRHARTTDSQH